ncbi:hypothetical protein BH18ACI3_BH18ACI3_20220 [soil metagenome]
MNSATETNSINLLLPKRTLESVAGKIAESYLQETGTEYSISIVIKAISAWLESHFDKITEDIEELVTSPGRPEAHEFRWHLERAVRDAARPAQVAVAAEAEANVFNGNRVFSFEKLAAMTAYLASKGSSIYKTKLNKLLFYSDFLNYYLHGQSISGARYVHLPFGPVPNQYESLLSDLSTSGAIQIVKGQTFELIQAGENSAGSSSLTSEETYTLDWVLEKYGKLSTAEISELSHREKAYRFTRPGEEIAYEYAKFFETLPTAI